MTIRAVIFDFGGVLVRTEDHSGRRKWEARLGLPEGGLSALIFDSETSLQATLGLVSEERVWAEAGAVLGLEAGEVRQLEQDFWSGDRLDTQLVAFLHGLRPRYRTAILSNAWSQARDAFVNRFGLGDSVDLMVISAEEGLAKPDRAIYQRTVERLGVRAEEAVFVDDMPGNVEAARTAGLQAIRFKSREQVIEDLCAMLVDEDPRSL